MSEFVETLFNSPLVSRIGWTILHSLWVLTVLACVTAAILSLLRNRSPHLRYVLGMASFAGMALAVVVTFWVVPVPKPALETASQIEEALSPPIAVSPTPIAEPTEDSVTPTPPSAPKTIESTELTPRQELAFDRGTRDQTPAAASPSKSGEEAAKELSLQNRFLHLIPWIAGFWMAGVVLLAIRRTGGLLAARRLRSLAKPVHHRDLVACFQRLADQMGVSHARILASDLVSSPAVIGVLKPTVLLPLRMVTGLSEPELRAVFAHELAHIRRHDYLLNLAQSVAETLLFYHPAVWWLSRRIRHERENSCDDIAVQISGDPVAYAGVLLKIGEQPSPTHNFQLALHSKPLASRIRRLLGAPVNRGSNPCVPLTLLSVLLAIAFHGLGSLNAPAERSHIGNPEKELVPQLESETSLFFLVGVPGQRNHDLWRLDLRNGNEVGRKRILELGESFNTSMENFPTSIRDGRHAISHNGVIIDLVGGKMKRKESSWGSYKRIAADEAMFFERIDAPKGHYALKAHSLDRGGERLVREWTKTSFNQTLLSPTGRWMLPNVYGGEAIQLLSTVDDTITRLPIPRSIQISDLASGSSGPTVLWLNDETLLLIKSNAELVVVKTSGEIKRTITIPQLRVPPPGELKNLAVSYRLFRDHANNIIYQAGHLGAFEIDVKRGTWQPYKRFRFGHDFSIEFDWKRTDKKLPALRFGDGVIGRSDSGSVLATDGYLAIVENVNPGRLRWWSQETRRWHRVEDLNVKLLLGWTTIQKEENPAEKDEANPADENAQPENAEAVPIRKEPIKEEAPPKPVWVPKTPGEKRAAAELAAWHPERPTELPALASLEALRSKNAAAWQEAADYIRGLMILGVDHPAPVSIDGVGRYLQRSPSLPKEALPLIQWFLEDGPKPEHRLFGINALYRLKHAVANEHFIALSDSEDTAIIWGVLRVALDRQLDIPRAKLEQWAQHPDFGVRLRARELATRLNYGVLPAFDPVRVLRNNQSVADLLTAVAASPIQPPREAPLVVVRRTREHKNRPAQMDDAVGWLISDDGAAQVTLQLPSGARRQFKLGDLPHARVEILDDITPALKRISVQRRAAVEKRRIPMGEALRELVPSNSFPARRRFGARAWLDHLIIGQWLTLQERWEEAATILLPLIGEADFPNQLGGIVRAIIAQNLGHGMLDAFAHRRYADALKLAEHIDRDFKGSMFHAAAQRLKRELPQRENDFRALSLPSQEQWRTLQTKLSRGEQIDYLCKRLRLSRSGHSGWTYLTPQNSPAGESAINPLVELVGPGLARGGKNPKQGPNGLNLTVGDIPQLAPYLQHDWTTIDITYWREYDPRRGLRTVRHLLVPVINHLARHDLCYPLYKTELSRAHLDELGIDKLTDKRVATEVKRIIEWSRGKKEVTDADLSLAALEAGLRRGKWYLVEDTARKLIAAKDRRATALIARFLETDDYELQKVKILVALEDSGGTLAARTAPKLFESSDFAVRATAAGVAATLPEYKGALPALKFIRSKGTSVNNEDFAKVVAALAKSKSSDARKLLAAITVFDATTMTRWPFTSRPNIIRSLSKARMPHGLQYYRTLLGSNGQTRDLIPADTPPIKVGNARNVSDYIAYEIIHQYAPKDPAIIAIRKNAGQIEERLKRLQRWIDEKIGPLER